MSVVADTHAIIWYLRSPEKLSTDALTSLDLPLVTKDHKIRNLSNIQTIW
jgi:hypothetical protein